MLDSQTHDNKEAPAYLVRASSQAALGAVLMNALKELGASDAIGPWTSTDVTASFGSWLRTIRSAIPPSELVVTTALRQCLPQFLLSSSDSDALAKFILEKQDKNHLELFRLTG